MGSLKKFIWFLMVIVLVLFGVTLLTLALDDSQIKLHIFSLLTYSIFRYVLIICGLVLLIFALILLVDILSHRLEDRDYLIESNSGNIYITRNSLEGLVESSVSKFSYAKLVDVDVIILEGEKIQVELKCDVFVDRDYNLLGQMIQNEVEDGLRILTGIEDVKVDIQLNNVQNLHKRELR